MAFPNLCCWKIQFHETDRAFEPQQVSISSNGAAYSYDEQRLRSNSIRGLFAMPVGEEDTEDAELWCYAGPSRFLFTIIEETEGDFEAEDLESTVGENTESSAGTRLREMAKEEDSTLMPSSPPPTLKFLVDAEEKHRMKRLMEEALKAQRSCSLNESREKKEASVARLPPLLLHPPQNGRKESSPNGEDWPSHHHYSSSSCTTTVSPVELYRYVEN
ncbi:hypothetical protein B296_00012474 [Ensete ventricosum]|uniref:Uncharacterized protein n=1 Tax=Ensete ventricosum TaxID=4639 RepID=A0A427A6E3_ENSVE|nr:hypothetical protein B296_00012474 [Ensete ventricosum]